jgi:hypothetical protein
MSRGNTSGLERSSSPAKIGTDASTISAPRVPRISHEILRDLGMSDDAIAQYFSRFRHDRSEQFVRMVLHKHHGMCRDWRRQVGNEGAVSWPEMNITPTGQRA